jgi:hypothetical protein
MQSPIQSPRLNTEALIIRKRPNRSSPTAANSISSSERTVLQMITDRKLPRITLNRVILGGAVHLYSLQILIVNLTKRNRKETRTRLQSPSLPLPSPTEAHAHRRTRIAETISDASRHRCRYRERQILVQAHEWVQGLHRLGRIFSEHLLFDVRGRAIQIPVQRDTRYRL